MNYTLPLLLLLLLKSTYSNQPYFCCCIIKKDYFRGFQNASFKKIHLKTQTFDFKTLINTVNQDCFNNNGFPDFHTISRLLTKSLILSPDCEVECGLSRNQLNDVFQKRVEKERQGKVNELKAKLKDLKKEMIDCERRVSQIMMTGESVLNTLSSLNLHTDSSQCSDFGNINPMKSSLFKIESKSKGKSRQFKSSSHKEQENLTFGSKKQEKSFLQEKKKIQKSIDTVKIEILEYSKNRRPLDYILNKFFVGDELIYKLIQLFKYCVDEVMKDYYVNLNVQFEEAIRKENLILYRKKYI